MQEDGDKGITNRCSILQMDEDISEQGSTVFDIVNSHIYPEVGRLGQPTEMCGSSVMVVVLFMHEGTSAKVRRAPTLPIQCLVVPYTESWTPQTNPSRIATPLTSGRSITPLAQWFHTHLSRSSFEKPGWIIFVKIYSVSQTFPCKGAGWQTRWLQLFSRSSSAAHRPPYLPYSHTFTRLLQL